MAARNFATIGILAIVFALGTSFGAAFQPISTRTTANVAFAESARKQPVAPSLKTRTPITKLQMAYEQQLPSNPPSNRPSILKRARLGVRNLFRRRNWRAKLAGIVLGLFLFVQSALGAPSGGRIGGSRSFSAAPRSTYRSAPSRSSTLTRPRTPYNGPRPAPNLRHIRNWTPSYHGYGRQYRPDPRFLYVRRPADNSLSAPEIAVIGVTSAAAVYGLVNHAREQWADWPTVNSPLGPGLTVGSLTVALEVPDRANGSTILDRLRQLARTADTVSASGLAALLADTAVELLRHQPSISSAYAESKHYRIYGEAEREFQIRSVQGQSKFDRLTGTCE